MGSNCHTLIKVLEGSNEALDGRFARLSVVNRDRSNGQCIHGGGVLSVVFKAHDLQKNQAVAIKFFDPDLQGPGAAYRYELFRREAELLVRLEGNPRCLQIVQDLRELELTLTNEATGNAITIPCQYFVTEWLEDDINGFFDAQETFPPQEKLAAFRDIALAVMALHRSGVVHRDLKPDNLRCAKRDTGSMIVSIDLGAAAASDCEPIGTNQDYVGGPVGAPAYAPLEARFGLSGVRQLGRHADYFALGCMLHDLFNTELFIFRQMSDAGFSRCMLACQRYQLIRQFDQLPPQEVLSAWEQMIGQSKRQVTIPSMIGPESSLPPSIRDISERLLSRLTAVDYRDRLVDHETVLRMIDTAIKILRNQLADQRALERRRIRRQQRLLKLCARPNKPPLPISRNLHGDDENV